MCFIFFGYHNDSTLFSLTRYQRGIDLQRHNVHYRFHPRLISLLQSLQLLKTPTEYLNNLESYLLFRFQFYTVPQEQTQNFIITHIQNNIKRKCKQLNLNILLSLSRIHKTEFIFIT